MSSDFSAEIDEIRRQGLWRELRGLDSAQGAHVHRASRPLINFSSNDYLGLAASAELRSAMIEGVEKFGAGAGASRLVCGTLAPHLRLEEALADFKGAERALVFSSGYAAAVGTIPAIVTSGDTVILDKLAHASLIDAARLSGATIRVFPHNHLVKLDRLLAAAKGRVLVVTESVFSMDGDASPLAEIVALKERHGALLLLDEAHSFGVLGPQGRGLAAQLGLESRVDLQLGTLSKAAGLSGGYLAGSSGLVHLLVNRARSFIYSTAPPPAIAHAGVRALDLIASAEGDRRRARVLQLAERLKSEVPVAQAAAAAILPLHVGDECAAVDLSAALLERGLLIPAIRYPTVARGKARLRLTLSADHTDDDVAALVAALRHMPS